MKTLILSLLLLAGAATLHAADDNEITAENVIRLMNQYRAEASLPPLGSERRLMLAAEDRMRHMEDEGYWAHNAPDGMRPFVWVKARNYEFRTVGENLASGFETAALLVQAWMESAGHRANIMSTDYEDCGIAIIEGSTLGPATGKAIVVLFGRQQDNAKMVARAR
ncbi:MAG TPA: CAP domain-containing protein [Thermoanaerobaculia bacterium]|jgi:uncharacterized protein YkwD